MNKRYVYSGHFYIKKVDSPDTIKIEDSLYTYFQIENQDHTVIDLYDFIHINTDVRIDVEDGEFRIYPPLGSTSLAYSIDFHAIVDPKQPDTLGDYSLDTYTYRPSKGAEVTVTASGE